MKKIIKTFIAAATVLTFFIPDVYAAPVRMSITYDGKEHQYNEESIELHVNGVPIELPLMPPIILDGRTLVPSREVFEPLGATVDWKAATSEVYIGYDGTLIILKPDSKTADIDGVLVPMENPAKIINNKLMVPARFVAEQLGIPVSWDPEARIVFIGEAATEQKPAQSELNAPSPVTQQPVSNDSAISVDVSPMPITQIAGQPVNIIGFKADGGIFTVSATGPVTRVDKLLLPENRLVLDIYDATNMLSASSYPSQGFSGVSSVRNSQFQITPDKITRVVFDLAGANRFTVSLSADRKSVIVSFEENSVTGVDYLQSSDEERITISCARTPAVSAFRMFSPDRLVFDIPGSKYASGFSELTPEGRFAQKIRASQFELGTSRIVIDLSVDAQYKIVYEGNNAVITLTEPTYKNIKYSQQPQAEIILSGAEVIDTQQLTHKDDYLNGRYVLSLPGDYSGVFGYGEFEINDSLLKSVAIQTSGGRTELIFSQKYITAYKVESGGGNIVIRPVSPREVYGTVVYVDAGHGGSDPGAIAGGFEEKNLNLNIATKLYELLEADSEIKVYMSRLGDEYPQNIDRALNASFAADLFLSIHHNASDSPRSNGTEVLYLNHEGEVYPRISSEAVARIIQTNLSHDIGTTDRGVVKRGNLIVLNQSTVPAVIIEVAFVTNPDDLAKVSTQDGRNKVAESVYRSVKEIFRQYPTNR